MKLILALFGCLLLFVAIPVAAKDKKEAPPAKPAQADTVAKPATVTNAPPVAPSAALASPAALKFDDYMKELGATLKLTAEEKKSIETAYLADGVLLKNILNNDSLSPLQQARQVSDLRDTRNAKIEALLNDTDRQQAFLKIEAKYRVALTELAVEGGLVPAS